MNQPNQEPEVTLAASLQVSPDCRETVDVVLASLLSKIGERFAAGCHRIVTTEAQPDNKCAVSRDITVPASVANEVETAISEALARIAESDAIGASFFDVHEKREQQDAA